MEGVTISTTKSGSPGIRGRHSGTGNVDIDATGVSISTTGMDNSASPGVFASHGGSGNIVINIQGKTTGATTTPSTITTTSEFSFGVDAGQRHTATDGDVTLTLGDTQINTSGNNANGVYVQKHNDSSGTMTATLNSGVTITTSGEGATGVHLLHENTDTTAAGNNVALTASGITVTTARDDQAPGLWASRNTGRGDVTMDVSDITITTETHGPGWNRHFCL